MREEAGKMKRPGLTQALLLVFLVAASAFGATSYMRITLKIANPKLSGAKLQAALQADAQVVRARLIRLYAGPPPMPGQPTQPPVSPLPGLPIVQIPKSWLSWLWFWPAPTKIVALAPDPFDPIRVESLVTRPGVFDFRYGPSPMKRDTMFGQIFDYLDTLNYRIPGPDSTPAFPSLFTIVREDPAVLEDKIPAFNALVQLVDTNILGPYRFMYGMPESSKAGRVRVVYLVEQGTEMSDVNGRIVDSSVAFWTRSPYDSSWNVAFKLKKTGNAKDDPLVRFEEITKQSGGRRLASVLDSVVLVAPVITGELSAGAGMFPYYAKNVSGACDMANVLESGALAQPLVIEKADYTK
jgi:hypothetical protein